MDNFPPVNLLLSFTDIDLVETRALASLQTLMPRQMYPMMFRKNGKTFHVAVTGGQPVTLIAPDSDVSVEVAQGVKAVIAQHTNTNFQAIETIVTSRECLVSPIVHLHVQEEGQDAVASPFKYKVRIPHCLSRRTDYSHLKVRCGDIYSPNSLKEIPRGKQSTPSKTYYEIHRNYIILHTNHFCHYFCSSGQKICNSPLVILPFGYLSEHTYVKVKVFLCSLLYNMTDHLMVSFGFYYVILTKLRILEKIVPFLSFLYPHLMLKSNNGIEI